MAIDEGRIIPINLDEEMQNSYLLYSMSVIISRALPDVRDGLKPVQRRILRAMDDLNLGPNAQMRKSAKIAGDTSGNYHPHGEAVIYPTMVRMAQEFSSRYPLIQGQGNFGCFTGDTRIKLLDGTEKSFEELAALGSDATFHVYSVDASGRIVIGEGRNARITRRSAELVEVTLDNGEAVRCTPDHRFLLRDGTYKQAQCLTAEDSLMPGYFDTAPVKPGLNDYLRIFQPASTEYEFVHRLADEYNAKRGLARPLDGPFVRHHKNFNRRDNRPSNIERMEFLEHLHLHAEQIGGLWQDESFREAQKQGVQRYYHENPEAIEARRRRFIVQNRAEAFRHTNGKRVSITLRRRYATHPELRAEISRRMKALWQDPDYRVRMSAALQGIEKRPLSPEEKTRVAGIISEKSRAMWSDEAKRAQIVESISQAMASESIRSRLSELARQRWQDPEYRARYGEAHFSEMARALWSDPATRERHHEKIERQWADDTFRGAQRAGVQRSNARRLQDNPRMMQEMADRAAASLARKWTDPEYRGRVVRQRIARYGSRLLAQFGEGNVTPEIYEQCRDAGWIPRLNRALSYFDGFEQLLEASRNYNHRVISVQPLAETTDVYDITVDEYHNFLLACGVFVHNSVDGDPPAAMRYTEVRMSAYAMEMLADIEKNTVDWVPNYDQSRQEPVVLPARMPNLLMNGSTGIAVGMATNIPPHNLGELCDAIILAIDKPEVTLDELIAKMPGPDFPTAGLILGTKGIRQAYATGRGSVIMQAKTQIEPMDGGKNAIVITELPYQVNKRKLIEEHIAELAKQKKVDGIVGLNDYTDKHGMRIVVELRRDAHPQKILNYLLKHTPLRSTFGVNMLALVNGGPKMLSLPQMIQHFIRHREEVLRRRTEWELDQARKRAHILEGLIRALDLIDQIIALIRGSRTVELARTGLVEQFQFSVLQADAILQMQLQRLVNLERQKLQDEFKELIQRISYLEDLLANASKILGLIKEDLKYLKQKYGDPRRTRIVPIEADQIGEEDTIPEEEMIVTITRNGYIKRVSAETYRVQKRGGRGVIAATSKEEDEIDKMFVATTHHFILFFTDRGRVYRVKAYEVPLGSRQAMGTAVINLISIEPGEKITATVPIRALDQNGFLVMATANGEIKRSKLSEFQNLRANGLKSFDIEEDDRLCWVHLTSGKDEIVMATEQGQAVCFPEAELRASGRASGGVRGVTIEPGDRVVGMEVARPELDLLVVSQNGYGKRTALAEYPRHHRGGKGVRTMRVTDKTGPIADLKVVEPDDRLLIITAGGIVIRTRVNEIRRIGRSTEGVRVINLGPEDRVASIEAVAKAEASEHPTGARVDINAMIDGHNGRDGHDGHAALAETNGDAPLIEEEIEPEPEEEE